MRSIVFAFFFLGPSDDSKPGRPLHHARQVVSEAETTESAHDPTGTRATADTITPTATSAITDTPSYLCSSELEEIAAAMPTEPPEYSSFSSSYYETNPRTADNPDLDCAWIEDLPEDLDEATLEDQNRTTEWFLNLDPREDGELFDKAMAYLECASEDIESQPCQEEFETYVSQVQDRAESAGIHGRGVLGFAGMPASVFAAVVASSLVFI